MVKGKGRGKGKKLPPRRREPSIFRPGFSNLNFVLEIIRERRNAEDYRAAETLRQADGSGTMAAGSAAQQAAIRLMISTWESIANLVLPLDRISQETIFGSTPIGYMWDALSSGVVIIRQNDNDPAYAGKFEQLDNLYNAWLSTKPADYQSRAAQGMNTNFG
jgi:hypothetical protein